MDLHADIELARDVLVATVGGDWSVDSALSVLTEVIAAAVDKGLSRIVVNMLGVEGVFSTSEGYVVGTELAAYVRKQRMHPRIAFVEKPQTAWRWMDSSFSWLTIVG
jgi:hypothetical protein